MAKSAIRIRARKKGEMIEVKVLISHPMETGFRRDAWGKMVPVHFIEQVECFHNDQLVLKTHWGVAVSKDPFLSFKIVGGKVGDQVKIRWKDNQGEKDSLEVAVS